MSGDSGHAGPIRRVIDGSGAKDGQMNRWNVIVVALEGTPEAARRAEEIGAELSRAWPGPHSPRFAVAPLAAVMDATPSETHDAAVLVGPAPLSGVAPSESTILRLLSQFEEASIPVLALTAGPEASAPGSGGTTGNVYALAGALVCDVTQRPELLAANLQGLLHRQAEVTRLRREVALGQRFQGSLAGEMDKLHDELQLAAVVQRELLPTELPSVCGVEFAALWRPVNYVSGDIYDVIRLGDDHVGIFLADAVGHGVPAALMTMVLRQSLQPMEIRKSVSRIRAPGEVLSQLNQAMIDRQGGATRFATALYGVLDCRSRVLTLSGAGHPHPLRVGAAGACTELKTQGGLLGVFPDETFDGIEVELAADDRLLFFTDGFEQAFPAPQDGEHSNRVPTARYRHELELLANEVSPGAAIGQISQRLDCQRSSLHQVDDLTLICVHARALGPGTTTSAGGLARDQQPERSQPDELAASAAPSMTSRAG